MSKLQFSKSPHTGARSINLPLRLIVSALQGLLCAGLALLACAWLYCRVDCPDYAAPAAAICCAGLGAAVTAFSAAKAIRQAGLWIGLGCGGLYFVFFVVAAMVNGQTEFTAVALWKLVCLLAFGGLGGIFGVGNGGSSAPRRTVS